MEEDTDLVLSYVVTNPSTFRPLKVYPVIVFYCIYMVMYLTVCIASFLATNSELKCDLYFVIIYCNVCAWILTALVQDYFRRKHYFLKLRGYISFCTSVSQCLRSLFVVASLGNIIMILLITVHLYINRNAVMTCDTEVNFFYSASPHSQLAIAVIVECCTILYIMFGYTRKVMKFNSMKPRSENLEQEMPGLYVGCRPSDQEIDDLISKQADMIDYYREVNKRLVEKLAINRSDISNTPIDNV